MRISDWSSDVCSSDLRIEAVVDVALNGLHHVLKLLRGRPPLGVDVVRQSRLKQHLDNFAEAVAFADGVIVETTLRVNEAASDQRRAQLGLEHLAVGGLVGIDGLKRPRIGGRTHLAYVPNTAGARSCCVSERYKVGGKERFG